jgi:hypothetical protein
MYTAPGRTVALAHPRPLLASEINRWKLIDHIPSLHASWLNNQLSIKTTEHQRCFLDPFQPYITNHIGSITRNSSNALEYTDIT